MKSESARQSPSKAKKVSGLRSARQFPWTKEEDSLLGKLTDPEVAEKLNRALACVRDRRSSLGKPAVGRAPQPDEMEREPKDRDARLFSEKSNQELRSILGWSYRRIETRRRQLGGNRKNKAHPLWTLEEDRLLGTKPDAVLAKMFGRSVTSVRSRRGKKRIRVTKKWRPEDDKILGTRTDKQIALLLGRSVTNVAWRRKILGIPAKSHAKWTQRQEALLGTKSDEELARACGRTAVAVEARRIQLGKPKFDAAFKIVRMGKSPDSRRKSAGRVNAKPGAAYCTWTAQEDALLGKLTDDEVARKLGYSVKRVRRRRIMLGLPSNNPRHRSWTKAEIALLGTRPDREVGQVVNRSIENVRYKRLELGIPFHNPRYETWKPAELALLGKLPDKHVVRLTGHSLKSVINARAKRQILSFQRTIQK